MSFEPASRAGTTLQSEPFEYVPTPGDYDAGNGGADSSLAVAATTAAAQAERREKEAYERGLLEGENRIKANCEARLAASQEAIRKALEAFRIERDEYFNRIEPEVVQLALAIARKILHRESQIDPLLLTGLVHVALEQLDAGSRVRLKVHPADTHFWNEFFARTGGNLLPELSGDPSLQHGECLLETEMGSTQISLETQLKEIEQGFFDLLEQRPRVR
jgi:flagellar assembly protein FliH